MKIRTAGFCILILLLALFGCISLKIQAPFPQENRFGRMFVCSEITKEKDQYSPAGITSDFNTQDKKAICFVRLYDINREIQVHWKWYDPDGFLVRDTVQFDSLVNTQNDFIAVQTMYDELEFAKVQKPLKSGVWTVVFYLEDRLVGSLNFTIKEQ